MNPVKYEMDGADDEVKVFRNADVDDPLDVAQSSHQLTEDKKDVAFETEMETANPTPVPKNIFFNPLLAASMFGQSGAMYPVLMQSLSPHFRANPMMSPLLASPQFAALAMYSPNPYLSTFKPTPSFVVNPVRNSTVVSVPQRKVHKEKKEKNHIKKPCNAFMMFMRENRSKFIHGANVKQSSELNKEMGKAWHELSKAEQEPYFDMAKKAREDHAKLYPNWTARDNYAINKKKKKRRERSIEPTESNEQKKCRARFGIDKQHLWCKHCKRKKKCLNVRDGSPDVSSTTNPTTPTNHLFASPASAVSSIMSPTPYSITPL